jgi:hypothetical protein
MTSAAATPAPGDWTGLFLGTYAEGAVLTGLTVQHAGGGTLDPTGAIHLNGAEATIASCSVTDSAAHGLLVGAGSVAAISDSTFNDNALDGVQLGDNDALAVDVSPTYWSNETSGNGGYGVGFILLDSHCQ